MIELEDMLYYIDVESASNSINKKRYIQQYYRSQGFNPKCFTLQKKSDPLFVDLSLNMFERIFCVDGIYILGCGPPMSPVLGGMVWSTLCHGVSFHRNHMLAAHTHMFKNPNI